jgi:flagellar biosynthetic protein FliR
MNIVIDAGWVIGVLLAIIRVAGFVVASPIFGKAIPATGRMALVLVLGYSFGEPVAGALDLPRLVGAAATNAAVGVVLGLLTGLIFYVFTVAGALIDFTSSLSSAQVFDPLTQSQNPVFGRFFNLGAIALFLVLGGDRLLIAGLGTSFEAIGLTGSITLNGAPAAIATDLVGRMMIAAVELAMPALAALFLVEVVLGIASRFAPQANVFLIGLPAKVVAALASVGAVLLLVPETMDGVFVIVQDTFRDALAGMGLG